MSSAASLILRYPAFATLDPTVIELALGDAAAELDALTWGSSYVRAACALAAHFLYIRSRSLSGGDAGGQVTSRRAGPLGETYSAPSDGSSLSSSIYGVEYLRLRARLALPVVAPRRVWS